ncbi:YdaS family helix-turn-helix protein [Achromobacter sp. UBA4530]|uniref:YdaS family helix-turn-helix protein n=1 Tax=Achromobacter sp. UBA4530 TaxID=1945912 RepID=UPI00257CFA5C|nr:YdaS family helix-turn-helix protein [Achromobacter sp. UBA4530]
MDKKKRHDSLARACDIAGGQSALARILKVTPVSVHEWVNLKRPLPSEHCPLIEEATGVLCEELLPSFRWDVLRKPKRQRRAQEATAS